MLTAFSKQCCYLLRFQCKPTSRSNKTFVLGQRTAAHLDQVWGHHADQGGVGLHHRGEAHHQPGLTEAATLEHHLRLLTPGNKVVVVLHLGHHLVDLLHGEPAEGGVVRRGGGGIHLRSADQTHPMTRLSE